ncbi:MAG: FecR domain-containing protein [Fibrobacter sp.]|nr:FecR domain-containing protein [Fibrobacter sp.]
MFSNNSLFRGIAVLAFLPALAFSAPAAGKVRSAIGEVERQKIRQDQWVALRVGANIYQSDKVRTGNASELIFALPEGSSITITENSEVEMSNLLEPNGQGGVETHFEIKKGHINFAVRKLQDKKSKFTFSTGTATASIRGTEGYIGGEGAFFAGLKTGKLDITPKGSDKLLSVVAGETMLGRDSMVVLKLPSSGDARFAKRLSSILADESKSLDVIVAEVQKADSLFQEELKAQSQAAAGALPENGFVLTTNSPFEVCEQGLVVEGSYRTNDTNATLIVSMGKSYQSNNLIKLADGSGHSFMQKIPVSDENGLWTADKATITFAGGGVSDTKTLDVTVHKVCSDVNHRAPSLTLSSYDSLRCSANISVGGMQNDAGILSVEVDGAPISEDAITRNAQKRIKLKAGSHEYVLKAEDQAGNRTEVSRTMGCYPRKPFNVDVTGPAREVLGRPHGSPNAVDRIVENLQFRIKIPENNPEFLYKVIVKQNGKIILQETLSQIQGLDYLVPVELTRGGANRLDIEVIHKSGYRSKAKKIYEVY